MALFSFAESSLAVRWAVVSDRTRAFWGRGVWRRGCLRCPILGLALREGGCHVPIVLIAVAAPLRILRAHMERHVEAVAGGDARLVLRGRRLDQGHGARGILVVFVVLEVVEFIL